MIAKPSNSKNVPVECMVASYLKHDAALGPKQTVEYLIEMVMMDYPNMDEEKVREACLYARTLADMIRDSPKRDRR